LGFKPDYYEEALASPAEGLWFEVHAENYMVDGGARLAMLDALRDARPLSIHGVGLSLAGSERPNPQHLDKFRSLVDRSQPTLVSEHLAWSRHGETCFPDLLPFPRSREALMLIARNIDIVQNAIGRQLLVENPSLYLTLPGHELGETEFLAELARLTGCGLLIDVNNIFVSANNLGFDPHDYIDALALEPIGEIHLAGHSLDPKLGAELLIDSHDMPVSEPVWALFRYLLERSGPVPTLIERDGNLPAFAELMAERDRAAAELAAQAEPAHA